MAGITRARLLVLYPRLWRLVRLFFTYIPSNIHGEPNPSHFSPVERHAMGHCTQEKLHHIDDITGVIARVLFPSLATSGYVYH